MLPPKLQTQIDKELAPGEEIIWSHKPRLQEENPYIVLWGGFMLLFGSACVLAGLWFFTGPRIPGPFPKSDMNFLLGICMLFIGLQNIIQVAVIVARNHCTGYVITNQRAILLAGGMFLNPKPLSFYPKDLALLHIDRRNADQFIFRLVPVTMKGWTRKSKYWMAFFNVPNSRHVETLLKELQAR